MPKRTREHILQEESRRAFREALPIEWVIRPPDEDYGIDEEVQIFHGEDATAYYFFVQLKGCDGIAEANCEPDYRFKTERLRFYAQHHIPVVLVLYDSKNKRLYYTWVQDYIASLSPADLQKLHSQATVTVKFTRRLDGVSPSNIERELKMQMVELGKKTTDEIAFTIRLDYSLPPAIYFQLSREIRDWFGNNPLTHNITLVADGAADGTITIVDDVLTLRFGTDELGSLRLKASILQSVDDTMLLLKVISAVLLSHIGLKEQATDIIRTISASSEVSNPHLVDFITHRLIPYAFIASSRYVEGIEVAEQLLNCGHNDIAIQFAQMLFISGDGEYFYQRYRRFLQKVINSPIDENTRGLVYYNLANNLALCGEDSQAIRCLIRAARHNQTYLDQEYWWRELAGSLFFSGKYRCAEKCYKEAVAHGYSGFEVDGLIGDCLLRQGRFSEAVITLDAYMRKTEQPGTEAILNLWLAHFLATNYPDTVCDRQQSDRLVEQGNCREDEERCHLILEGIHCDPLNGFAWFNYASYLSRVRSPMVPHAFLACAIIQPWDVEAWANAILSMFFGKCNIEDNVRVTALIRAFMLFEGNLADELFDRCKRFLTPMQSDDDIREMISDLCDIATTYRNEFGDIQHKGVTVRIVADDGSRIVVQQGSG